LTFPKSGGLFIPRVGGLEPKRKKGEVNKGKKITRMNGLPQEQRREKERPEPPQKEKKKGQLLVLKKKKKKELRAVLGEGKKGGPRIPNYQDNNNKRGGGFFGIPVTGKPNRRGRGEKRRKKSLALQEKRLAGGRTARLFGEKKCVKAHRKRGEKFREKIKIVEEQKGCTANKLSSQQGNGG